MSKNRGFWNRFISPFRRTSSRSRSSSDVLPNAEIDTLLYPDNFQLNERHSPGYKNFKFKVPVSQSEGLLYVPKCLGDINASSILFGENRPERFSRDCWLESHLNRFGRFCDISVDNDTFDLEDTFSIHSETDSDFVYRPNDQNRIASLSSENIRFRYYRDYCNDIDGIDAYQLNFNDSNHDSDLDYQIDSDGVANDICDNFTFTRDTRYFIPDSSFFMDPDESGSTLDTNRNEDYCNDDDDDDATLRGSTGSLESTVSEVLGMLDDVITCHSGEMPPQPPPYSAVCNSIDTPGTLPPSTVPLELPPSYSDIFGPATNYQMDGW